MRIAFTLLFAVVLHTGNSFAQDDTTAYEGHFDTFPGFYIDKGEPLFTFPETPACFELMLFDKWGNLLTASTDHKFRIDQSMINDNTRISEGTILVYLLKYTTASGEEKRHIGTLVCYGYYCGG